MIGNVPIPKDTLPDTMIGWYSGDQYEVLRGQREATVPVYVNHLGHERVVTEVRKFSDGPPPNFKDAYCVGIMSEFARLIKIS